MKHNNYSKRGQALVIIAVGMIALVALTALSIDGGNAYSDRRHAQNAADTAALGAALAKIRGVSVWQDAGYLRATENGYDNNGASNTVQVISPPATGLYSCTGTEGMKPSPYTGLPACNEYVQVTITSHVKTYFAPMVGIREVTNTVQAVARAIEGGPYPPNRAPAINALSRHACDAVKIHGGNVVLSDGAGFYVSSDCEKYALNGDGNPTVGADKCIKVVGGVDNSKLTFVVTDPDPGCSSVVTGVEPYPEEADPNIICPANNVSISSTGSGSDRVDTLSPGVWKNRGDFPGNTKTVHLQSGTYCIENGDFSVGANQTLVGGDVLIYVKVGTVSFNGASKVSLDAPGSADPSYCTSPNPDCPFCGLLMYVDRSDTNPVTLNGGGDLVIEGSIRAPGSLCRVLGGGSESAPLNTQIACDTIEMGGSSGVYIKYDPCVAYKPMVKPQLEETK